jgi:hypothetical protein
MQGKGKYLCDEYDQGLNAFVSVSLMFSRYFSILYEHPMCMLWHIEKKRTYIIICQLAYIGYSARTLDINSRFCWLKR